MSDRRAGVWSVIPTVVLGVVLAVPAGAAAQGVEVSEDGHWQVTVEQVPQWTPPKMSLDAVYPAAPDWQNSLRRQVGGLAAVDMNSDGAVDVVVGCYISNSYPPYTDWENLIYFNTGAALEADPSWVSTDERSTGDVQVADINGDDYPDVFAANGGFEMAPSVIYFGGPSGPSTSPGWTATDVSWTNYAMPFDLDHDGDVDVVTANQGNSASDPYRPMYLYRNTAGSLEATPSWQSAETSIQNFLAFGDLDGDGWEDLAVSKWANFESGIYGNLAGTLSAAPVWTTGDTDTDKGVGWADVDRDGWPDLALGHDPTELFANDQGSLSLAWSSTATYFGHSDLRWCDIDLDGDMDLAEVHFSNGAVHLYENVGGALSAAPTWTYYSPHVGTALAFGDINGDGMPDLVLGNSGDASVMVFYNQIVPQIFADGFEDGGTGGWSEVVP